MEIFFTRGKLKKIKNEKKMPNQCHVSKFAELDGGGCFLKKKFYKDANQTKNFTRAKTGNSLYYRGGKHY